MNRFILVAILAALSLGAQAAPPADNGGQTCFPSSGGKVDD
jgi:hypothetical protein